MNFFKSEAFRSLAVLLGIVILAGALLSVLNGVFYVSEEELFARSMQKIYGYEIQVTEQPLNAEEAARADGTVNRIYLDEEGNYLLNATGTGAFQGGTVTVWVIVEMTEGKLSGVGKVVFDSTTVGNYYTTSSAFFENFDKHDDQVQQGESFSVSGGIVNVTTGATQSSNAINNAVNTAVEYVRFAVVGEEQEEPVYRFSSRISRADVQVTGNSVAYDLTVKGLGAANAFQISVTVAEGVITQYAIVQNGSTNGYENKMHPEIESLFLGMTLSELEAFAGEAFMEKLNADSAPAKGDAPGEISTGATFSNAVALIAALYATANYTAYLEVN